MPRKQKKEKHTVAFLVNGTPVSVTLFPPTGTRTSWYAYWTGLVSSRSTGQADLAEAVKVAENMLTNGGKQANLSDAMLTDEEFEAIQRAHFAKKTDPAAKVRAEKTQEDCLDAIGAFKAIIQMKPIEFREPISRVTADTCAAFQRVALTLPKNWRSKYPKSKEEVETLSPNTVLKWSRSLQAAFERANRNAGKTCIRGVVDEAKLLTLNPWTQFTWIEGVARPIRQFDCDDLLSFLAFLESTWGGVPVAAAALKFFLWSCCRKLEVAGLEWQKARLVVEDRQTGKGHVFPLNEWQQVDDQQRLREVHFEVVGKWGVERWFRVPEPLFRETLAHRTSSNFVFAAYSDQIRRLHADNPGCLTKIKEEFTPENFARWFYERVKEWSASRPNGSAYVHIFRKTALQLALDGEDDDHSRRVAEDACVTEAVLLGHYAKPKLWRRSNRTFRRILDSLPPDVAQRYGHPEDDGARLERELREAVDAQDWYRVRTLSALLGKRQRPDAG